jgi:hypothetical protein
MVLDRRKYMVLTVFDLYLLLKKGSHTGMGKVLPAAGFTDASLVK